MNKTLVIIPTYNESQNIKNVIDIIDGLGLNLDFLIIDDNSPDRTYDIVKNLMSVNSNVNLVIQERKMGLGTAYKKGFKWAIERDYSKIIQIDADLSHDPKQFQI